MYLRKNTVSHRTGKRVYICIAHNVWCARETDAHCQPQPQSRPVVLLRLGLLDHISMEVAGEIVDVLREHAQGNARAGLPPLVWVRRLAAEVRPFGSILRHLTSTSFAWTERVKHSHARRELLRGLLGRRPPDERVAELDAALTIPKRTLANIMLAGTQHEPLATTERYEIGAIDVA